MDSVPRNLQSTGLPPTAASPDDDFTFVPDPPASARSARSAAADLRSALE